MRPAVVDQSAWGKLRVTGADRMRFLQGMLTNDVASLAPGDFCRACLLSVKGRVLAVVDVVNREDAYLLIAAPDVAEKAKETLARHAIMDDVSFAWSFPPIHRVWSTPASVWTAPPIFAQEESSTSEEIETRRIEAGFPRYGIDVNEDNFPFEANLDTTISYTKGCYIGQEVVARAYARGHANKRLVGIRFSGQSSAQPGDPISSAVHKDAGVVTSSVVSPDFGPIALGYVHRSSWDPGTRVHAGQLDGVVTTLPFTGPL